MPSDIGKFVGRYFQVLACLSIASMIVSAVFFDTLMVDFSLLFLFWAAAYLIRHHPTARNWTIAVCTLVLLCVLAVTACAVIAGTDQMTLRIGGAKIDHPSLPLVAAICGVTAAMVSIPLALLLSSQARQEFRRSTLPD